MMLKRSSSSLWLRNIQLGLFSSAIAVGSVCLHEDPLVRAEGWLHGFGVVTWMVVVANAFGGLLVAVTIKYADNILRGFAGGVSLIIGAIGSHFIFDFHITRDFLVGVACVIIAIILYGGGCDALAGGGALTQTLPSETTEEESTQRLLSDDEADDLEMDEHEEAASSHRANGSRY